MDKQITDEIKTWKCKGGHVMGMVVRNGSGVRQLLLYRQATYPNPSLSADKRQTFGGGEDEVDVAAVIEGYVADVRCSICGRMRTWIPDAEAILRLIQLRGQERGDRHGLYGKYIIQKADGTPVDPKAVYFTLRLDTDPHARAAIRAYIENCREAQPELAGDLERLMRELATDGHG